MTERISRVIDVFLDSLNKGNLAKGTCSGCACGNIIANVIGIEPYIAKTALDYHRNVKENEHWMECLSSGSRSQRLSLENGTNQIKQSGFTIEEFRNIERTFEKNTKIAFWNYKDHSKEEIRKDQLNGLNAVISLILTFDENKEDKVEEIFTKKAQLIPC